jgi:5'-3' exonuclease
MDHVFLFDISAYLHRAMYVTYGDRAATADPADSSIARQACRMLANTMDTLGVQNMAVVCDSTESSFRCDEYPAYKADRKAHYPVFAAQAPRFYASLREIDVVVIGQPRYEADDLIASIVQQPGSYVIVSSDKDLSALVTRDARTVQLYDPMKNAWVTPGDVRAKFGIEPSQLYDYVGLVGDTSDGIPGVPGFGQKTAAKLLREFDSLDEIYSAERREALGEFCTAKQVERLLAAKDDAFLSRSLAVPRYLAGLYVAVAGCPAPKSSIVRGACG